MNTIQDKLSDAIKSKKMVRVVWNSVETYGHVYSKKSKHYFFGKYFEIEDIKSIYFEGGCWNIVL